MDCCDFLHYDYNLHGIFNGLHEQRNVQHNRLPIHGYGVRDRDPGGDHVLCGNNERDKHGRIYDLQHDDDSDPDRYCVHDGFDRYYCRYYEDDRHHDRPAHIYDLVNSDRDHDRTDYDSYRNANRNRARNNKRNDNNHLYRDGSYRAYLPADSWFPI
jgi:hypothetical protein